MRYTYKSKRVFYEHKSLLVFHELFLIHERMNRLLTFINYIIIELQLLFSYLRIILHFLV